MAMKLLQKARVVSIRDETPRVREVVLEHALRDSLQPVEAGAHVTVALPQGINRQYSLCGDPEDPSRYHLGVLLEDQSRGGSRAIHALRPGDTVFVSYPANSFALCPDASHHVLLAGGIGITPILSMAHRLASDGVSFEVHYGARSEADLGFIDVLKALCTQDSLHIYAEDKLGAPRPDIHALLRDMDAETHLYACGPSPMLDALDAAVKEAGLASGRVHKEQFGVLAASEMQGDPFEIEISETGEIVNVAADQTALEALRASGHIVPSSCEGGICGECRVDMVGGTPVHRDKVLSDEEKKDSFICCVSRGTERIAIQLPPQPKPAPTKERKNVALT